MQTKKQKQCHAEIAKLRKKHGFKSYMSPKNWSKKKLVKGIRDVPCQADTFPKNAPILNELKRKFSWLGFDWRPGQKTDKRGLERLFVEFDNYPTLDDGGYSPTLTDLLLMPIELFDGYQAYLSRSKFADCIGEPAEFNSQFERMNATGIGYKGLAGVSWLPGLEPTALSLKFESQLMELGRALFFFYDAISSLRDEPEVKAVVNYRKPGHILDIYRPESVNFVRPDIVIVKDEAGYRPVITELESAPAGQGMMHACQVGYEQATEIADRFVQFLNGRSYLVYATGEWPEYAREQGCFLKALRDRGVDARLVFDTSLGEIQRRAEETWQVPREAKKPFRERWNNDFYWHMMTTGFSDFVFGPEGLPENINDSWVVFRFGYYDNFNDSQLDFLRQCSEADAQVLNGLDHIYENKAILALLGVSKIRQWITSKDTEALQILDACVAESRLLTEKLSLEEFVEDRSYWLTKFGAWDGNNQSWGSRSLMVGSQCTEQSWKRSLLKRQKLDHPVVLQHVISSARFNVPYVDENGSVALLTDAKTRLTPFFLRNQGEVYHLGSTLTLRNSFRVHGATDAVEVPVVFD